MSLSILWSVLLAIHLIGITVWVGGAAYALFVLRPSLGLLDQTQRASIHLQTLNRFFRIVWHAMPMVLVTGWLLILHEGGFAHVRWPINMMQLFGVVMAGLFLRVFFGPYRKARRAIRPQQSLFDSIRQQITLVTLLGLLAIVCGSINHPF